MSGMFLGIDRWSEFHLKFDSNYGMFLSKLIRNRKSEFSFFYQIEGFDQER